MAKTLCVYCGKVGKRSHEHIFPQWLIDVLPDDEVHLTWSQKAGKVFPSAAEIADVCTGCNNGTLSDLDAYVRGLWPDYLSKYVLVGQTVTFRYEYDLLLRWLLKTAFNTARADGKARDVFNEAIVNYILGRNSRPEGLLLRLSVIVPSHRFGQTINPDAKRCSRIANRQEFFTWCATFVVAIRAYQFLVCIPRQECTESDRVRYFASLDNGFPSFPLEPTESEVTVPPSNYDAIRAYGKHISDNVDHYAPFMKQRQEFLRRLKSETHFANVSITGNATGRYADHVFWTLYQVIDDQPFCIINSKRRSALVFSTEHKASQFHKAFFRLAPLKTTPIEKSGFAEWLLLLRKWEIRFIYEDPSDLQHLGSPTPGVAILRSLGHDL